MNPVSNLPTPAQLQSIENHLVSLGWAPIQTEPQDISQFDFTIFTPPPSSPPLPNQLIIAATAPEPVKKNKICSCCGEIGHNKRSCFLWQMLKCLLEPGPSVRDSGARARQVGVFSSEHKGVSWHKTRKKWEAYVNINTAKSSLGYFKTEDEAVLTLTAWHANNDELWGAFREAGVPTSEIQNQIDKESSEKISSVLN